MIGTDLVRLAATLALASTGAAAVAQPLAGDALRDLVSDRRIYLATPLGGELPLYYRSNGVVDGSGEAIGLGRWLRPKDTGRWWIAGNKLCKRWQSWYNGETLCFTVTQLATDRIRWLRDNGETGVARVGR